MNIREPSPEISIQFVQDREERHYSEGKEKKKKKVVKDPAFLGAISDFIKKPDRKSREKEKRKRNNSLRGNI